MRLLLGFVLAAVCAAAPRVLAAHGSPWLVTASGLGALWLWARLGPRPFPGLLPGLLCLTGFAVILGSLIASLRMGLLAN